MISSNVYSRSQLLSLAFTPACQSNKCLLMGWGGLVDVQHCSLYLSESFLAFLTLFDLGLGSFFDVEEPGVSVVVL